MEELVADASVWMEMLPVLWIYAALFAITYIERVIPPIPGDMAVVFAGYLAGRGEVSFVCVIGLATVGGVLGFMTLYAVGRQFGPAILRGERFTWLPRAQIEKAEAWVGRRGYWVVAANRFLCGTRSVISFVVGMARLDPWKTAACATFSAVIWGTLIAWIGYAVGENWAVVQHHLRTYAHLVIGLVLVAVVLQIGRAYVQHRKQGRRRKASEDA